MSPNELRELLSQQSDSRVGDLIADLSDLGYTCSLLHLPQYTLRVAYCDKELDITIYAAYLDILGKVVSYDDAVAHIDNILYDYAVTP